MGPQSTIDLHLPALKSLSSKPFHLNRGKKSEALARIYLEKRGYIFVTNNLRLYYAEIDLLMLSPSGELVVIEVKSTDENDISFRPILGKNQKIRLSRVFENLVHTANRNVRMHLAAVNHAEEVTIFFDFLGDDI